MLRVLAYAMILREVKIEKREILRFVKRPIHIEMTHVGTYQLWGFVKWYQSVSSFVHQLERCTEWYTASVQTATDTDMLILVDALVTASWNLEVDHSMKGSKAECSNR